MHDAGVVDQRIDVTGTFEDLSHAALDRLIGTNVQLQHLHAIYVRTLPPAGAKDSEVLLCEQTRRRQADAGRGAGDENGRAMPTLRG
jgi:hypothetical protein